MAHWILHFGMNILQVLCIWICDLSGVWLQESFPGSRTLAHFLMFKMKMKNCHCFYQQEKIGLIEQGEKLNNVFTGIEYMDYFYLRLWHLLLAWGKPWQQPHRLLHHQFWFCLCRKSSWYEKYVDGALIRQMWLKLGSFSVRNLLVMSSAFSMLGGVALFIFSR